MIDNEKIDINFFLHIMDLLTSPSGMIKRNLSDIVDSFNSHQYVSKIHLINELEKSNILNKDLNVAIFGSWYGSIFCSVLSDKVKKINCFDRVHETIEIGKKIFNSVDNVSFIKADVLSDDIDEVLSEFNLIINTSCEHMKQLREWYYFDSVKNGTYFALQSNNMFDIEDHTNCVNSLNDFINQLPQGLEIMYSDSIKVPGWEDRNGLRFTVIARKVF
jgi:hypothetical protein